MNDDPKLASTALNPAAGLKRPLPLDDDAQDSDLGPPTKTNKRPYACDVHVAVAPVC